MLERFSGIFKPRERKETLEKERIQYLPSFDVLVISGFAGTGKTSAADEVNSVMIGTNFVKTGQIVRETQPDLHNISADTDKNIDLEQERLMLKTKHSLPLILESRLGGVIASDVTTRFHKEPRIVTILTTADEKVRYERLVKRKQEEYPELTPEEIIKDEIRRDREFVERMQTLYPRLLRGQHPFNPKITNLDGLPVYDFVVDTTNIPKGKVIDAIIKILAENGYITPLKREDFGSGNAGDKAFQTIKEGAPCTAYTTDNNTCNRLSIGTLDLDIGASLDFFPFCSPEHEVELRKSLTEEFHLNDKAAVVGKNGMSRN